ncbi:MAG: DUF3572 domain-containing protein [Proteobacteria bacterium]|nr:DUF3572 domain-containing protein [Pseudomonadota bacterium]
MDKEKAETIALQALAFLAKDDELLGRFLMVSGITPQELKGRFRDSDFLGGVLDAILGDDAVLLDFCNSVSLSPDTLVKARRALPGGYGEVYEG